MALVPAAIAALRTWDPRLELVLRQLASAFEIAPERGRPAGRAQALGKRAAETRLAVTYYELEADGSSRRRSKNFYPSQYGSEEECWQDAVAFKEEQDRAYQRELRLAGSQYLTR